MAVATVTFWTVASWLVLGTTAGVAHADVPGVTVIPQATCLTGGVQIINGAGAAIAVRLDLNGSPAFGLGPVTISNGDSRLLTGAVPTSGPVVYSAYLIADDHSETLLSTTTYVKPGYCGEIAVGYDDKCETVTATVTNHHGSTVTISFVKVSGATYPIGSLTVPDGQTASVSLPITAEVYDIGAYFTEVGDYLNKYVVKGLGKCPATSPTPRATTPAPTNLASTGNGSLVPVTVAGVALTLCGVLVIIGLRRIRFG
jgi:hypothetical protein